MKPEFDRAAIAIFEGDHATLSDTLKTPGLATHRAETGHPTLLQMVACEEPKVPHAAEAARILVEAGSETTWPLISAAGCDASTVLRTMLDLGVDVDANHQSWTPLDEALYWNNVDIARFLVEQGADVDRLSRTAGLGLADSIDTFFDDTGLTSNAGPIGAPFPDTITDAQSANPIDILNHAFVMAVNCAQRTTAELLLDRGARVNDRPPGYHWRGTALHAAIWRGNNDLVQWLLDCGADPTIRDGLADADALGWARHHGHDSIAEMLE